jgi:hypothetical protein
MPNADYLLHIVYLLAAQIQHGAPPNVRVMNPLIRFHHVDHLIPEPVDFDGCCSRLLLFMTMRTMHLVAIETDKTPK